jgi:hypothetical protein
MTRALFSAGKVEQLQNAIKLEEIMLSANRVVFVLSERRPSEEEVC